MRPSKDRQIKAMTRYEILCWRGNPEEHIHHITEDMAKLRDAFGEACGRRTQSRYPKMPPAGRPTQSE